MYLYKCNWVHDDVIVCNDQQHVVKQVSKGRDAYTTSESIQHIKKEHLMLAPMRPCRQVLTLVRFQK